MSRQNGDMREYERTQLHQSNLGHPQEDDDRAPETLKFIAKPERKVEAPVEGLNWIASKSTSTANFEPEDVRSREWVMEYHSLLSPLEHPPKYGITGHLRAIVFDDFDEYKEPLTPEDYIKMEGMLEVGKENTSRSKRGWGVKETTRDTRESFVHNEDEGRKARSGLLGRLKR